MGEKTKIQILEEIAVDVLEPAGFEVVLCEFKREGSGWVLRLFVDHPDGVTLDRCVEANRLMSEALDERDPLEQAYNLEVSSPGVDRPLVKAADFERFVGERVYVKLHRPVDGRKSFTGELKSFADNQIELLNEEDRRSYSLPYESVAKATLKPIINFD